MAEEMQDTCRICLNTCVEDSYPSLCCRRYTFINIQYDISFQHCVTLADKFCFECIKKWPSSSKTATRQYDVCSIDIIMQRENKALVYHYNAKTNTHDKHYFDQSIKRLVIGIRFWFPILLYNICHIKCSYVQYSTF